MFARVTTVQIPNATTSADILRVHERLLAELEGAKGFMKYTALVNRQSGTAGKRTLRIAGALFFIV